MKPYLIIPLLIFLNIPFNSYGEFYKWTDENGIKHFSNIPKECILSNAHTDFSCWPDQGKIFLKPTPPKTEKALLKTDIKKQISSKLQSKTNHSPRADKIVTPDVSVSQKPSGVDIKSPGRWNPTCKEAAANKYLLDLIHHHGAKNIPIRQRMEMISQIDTFTKVIRIFCGDNKVNSEILSAAKIKVVPLWIEKELDELSSRAMSRMK